MFEREKCLELLKQHILTKPMLKHSFAVEGAMAGYARHFGEDVEKWAACGLLHDLDYEAHTDEHPYVGARWLKEMGYPDDFVEAILGHGDYTGVARVTPMAKTLYAVDELSGFVIAVALMRPTRFEGLEPSSVKKKMKDKAFAKAVDRDHLKVAAEELGVDFTEHVALVIKALQEKEIALNAEGISLLD